jgi:hypothetical protein
MLTQNLMQMLFEVHLRRRMKRRQVMTRAPKNYLHSSGKKVRQYQRSFIKTGILAFFLVTSMLALILDTKL